MPPARTSRPRPSSPPHPRETGKCLPACMRDQVPSSGRANIQGSGRRNRSDTAIATAMLAGAYDEGNNPPRAAGREKRPPTTIHCRPEVKKYVPPRSGRSGRSGRDVPPHLILGHLARQSAHDISAHDISATPTDRPSDNATHTRDRVAILAATIPNISEKGQTPIQNPPETAATRHQARCHKHASRS